MKKVGEITREFSRKIGKRISGTVVYVHPRGRYYVVEFQCMFGTVREAYLLKGAEEW